MPPRRILLTITFYDDYAFSKAANLSYNAGYYPGNNANVKGQMRQEAGPECCPEMVPQAAG
jgi:hypothetical protein